MQECVEDENCSLHGGQEAECDRKGPGASKNTPLGSWELLLPASPHLLKFLPAATGVVHSGLKPKMESILDSRFNSRADI